MRNFSAVVLPNSITQTYDINGGEYCKSVDSVVSNGRINLHEAYRKLSGALEVDAGVISDLVRDWFVSGDTSSVIWSRITPSEEEVIVRFAGFVKSVLDRENESRGILTDCETRTFVFVCLNTGKTFVWVDFIG